MLAYGFRISLYFLYCAPLFIRVSLHSLYCVPIIYLRVCYALLLDFDGKFRLSVEFEQLGAALVHFLRSEAVFQVCGAGLESIFIDLLATPQKMACTVNMLAKQLFFLKFRGAFIYSSLSVDRT